MRNDFKEILEYAYSLGFELHMNTNATLITDEIAKTIADDVRKMLNVNDKVEITLLLEREIGKDMMLHNGLY